MRQTFIHYLPSSLTLLRMVKVPAYKPSSYTSTTLLPASQSCEAFPLPFVYTALWKHSHGNWCIDMGFWNIRISFSEYPALSSQLLRVARRAANSHIPDLLCHFYLLMIWFRIKHCFATKLYTRQLFEPSKDPGSILVKVYYTIYPKTPVDPFVL